MFSSQLPKRNSVSIFPASRSTTRTSRAWGSVSRRTSRRESVESAESPAPFRGIHRKTVSPTCNGRPSGFPPAAEAGAAISMFRQSVKDRPSLPARQWACANQNFPSFSRGSRCDPRARKTKHSRRQRGKAFVPAIRSPSACALVVKRRQCPIRIGLRLCHRNTARKKWLLVYGHAGTGIPKHGQRTLHQRQTEARQPSR